MKTYSLRQAGKFLENVTEINMSVTIRSYGDNNRQ